MHELMEKFEQIVTDHGGQCIKCGEKAIERLEFVHKRGWQHFIISGMNLYRPKFQIDAEVKKCDLLCSRCKKG